MTTPSPDYPAEPSWTLPRWTTARRPRPDDVHYDRASADRVIEFIRLLHHYKGDFAGKPFELLPWQEHELIRPLFGWKLGRECSSDRRPDGSCKCPRLYRNAYLECPKKVGKTQLAAGIAGYMAFGDGEAGAEVYTYAADTEQAKLAFNALSFGISYEGNKFEPRGIEALVSEIRNQRTHSFVRVQSSDVKTKHGPNAHCIVFDELHAQPGRELWEVSTSGVAARRQPLVCALTTAGWDRNSVCWEQHEYVRQISEGIYDDPQYLGIIYTVDEDADWTKPETWRAASPSLGVTVSESFYESQCRTAMQIPASQNSFRQLFLSQWTQQAVRFIPLDRWDACNELVDRGALRKQLCYGGLDLASTTDLAAFGLVFPRDEGYYDFIVQYFIPQENIRERSRRDRVPYETWVEQGLITATPGNVIDYAFIKQAVLDAKDEFDLREISYDPWNAVQLVQELEQMRISLVPMRQGYASLSAPTKELLRLVLERKFRHGRNPVLRWNADSAAATSDPAGNVKLDKSKSTARIDGLVTAVMSLDAALRHAAKKRRSVYESLNPPSVGV